MPNAIDVDILPCGIIKTDENNKVQIVNHYALELLGCTSANDVLGRNIHDLTSIASHIFLDSYIFPMLLEEGKVDEAQLSFKTSTGEKTPIVVNVKTHPDKTTYWSFINCVNRDQLYNEMLETRDTLQSQALDLAQLNTSILDRQSELQTFCHSLSHDFSGPLQRISHLVRMAMEDLQEGRTEVPEEFELLEAALKNTDILIKLTNGLVDYLVADVAMPCNEEIDLEEIIASVLALRDQKGNSMPVVHRTTLPTLYGSKVQLQVLFKNLIENAIKFNENDPVITISHHEDRTNSRHVISIKDNGIGMSDTDSIFTPFKRLQTVAYYNGSGLGLSIVKKLLMNHGGDIRVESTPGKGSTFYLSLPMKTD